MTVDVILPGFDRLVGLFNLLLGFAQLDQTFAVVLPGILMIALEVVVQFLKILVLLERYRGGIHSDGLFVRRRQAFQHDALAA